MKTAQELLGLAEKMAPEIISNTFSGVREHIIKRCEQQALEGRTYYDIYLKMVPSFCQKFMVEKCMEIANEFEENGYFISVDYYTDFNDKLQYIITVSWSGVVQYYHSKLYKVINEYHTPMKEG